MINRPLPGHGPITPYGILVHTTGGSIPDKAAKEGKDIVDVTIGTYSKMAKDNGNGPHYAITPEGQIIQFREPTEKAWHAAVSTEQRRNFISGFWETDYNRYAINDPKDLITWWKLRWPGVKSPQHLYPGKSPNEAYVGIEMVPCLASVKGKLQPIFGFGATPKSRFTAAQYSSLAILCAFLSESLQLPEDWFTSSRLVGHEDVNPYTRPGWDPGAYTGAFDWGLLKGIIQSMILHGVKVKL